MPLITVITPTKKGDRYSIFLDGKFAFSLGEYVLLKYKLKENQNLNEEGIQEIVFEENKEYLKERALRYVSSRPRSEKEVTDKLNEILYKRLSNFQGHSETLAKNLVDSTLEFLRKYDYLNDKAFVKWLVEQRVNQGKGPMFVKQDLFQKGISSKLAEQALSVVDFTQALKKEYSKALKKYAKEEDGHKRKNKLTRYLVSKGFSYDQIEELN